MRPLLIFSLPIVGLALLSLAVYSGCSSKRSDLRAMPFRGQPDLTLPGGEHAAGLAKADFNRDGFPDFVYLSGSKLNVLLGERSTKFTSRRTISGSANDLAGAIDAVTITRRTSQRSEARHLAAWKSRLC